MDWLKLAWLVGGRPAAERDDVSKEDKSLLKKLEGLQTKETVLKLK